MTFVQQKEIQKKHEHELFRKVLLKYKIMRIRSKISFMALEKRMTVFELFVITIKKSYLEL